MKLLFIFSILIYVYRKLSDHLLPEDDIVFLFKLCIKNIFPCQTFLMETRTRMNNTYNFFDMKRNMKY